MREKVAELLATAAAPVPPVEPPPTEEMDKPAPPSPAKPGKTTGRPRGKYVAEEAETNVALPVYAKAHRPRGPPPPLSERAAYTIPEFCSLHGFARRTYYKLKMAGLGPIETRLGKRVLISREAAAKWLREREAASAISDEA
jgi:hypothetical protein